MEFNTLFFRFTNNASSYFKFIVMWNLLFVSFILMMFIIILFLYHILLMYFMSYFWYNFISPVFLLIFNRFSESRMFDIYFGLNKTVSVESISNRISSFIFTACANEQCNHVQKITGSFFYIDNLLPLVVLLSLLLECTCCWALFIA